MSNIPCCNKISCPGAGDSQFDSPVANLTSELPDQDLFIGLNWGWDNNFPPLGSNWTATTCLGVCTSAISQEDANLCAARANLICVNNQWPVGGGPGDPDDPNTPRGIPQPLFVNTIQSCTFSCADGSPFTWTVNEGFFISASLGLSNSMAHSYACRLAAINHICLSTLLTESCVDVAYSSSMTPQGGRAPFTWELISGEFPPGLFPHTGLDQKTFTLSGTPNTAGDYTFMLRATDANGNFMQKSFTIHILEISQPETLPQGQINVAYSQQFTITGTPTTPVTWQVIDGALPAGLSLSSSGLLSGTPTGSGASYNFTVSFSDATGVSCAKDFTLTVDAPLLDFNLLHWGNAFVGSGGTGTASFTPSNANSASFSAANSRSVLGDSAACQNVATITYNGPAVACNLHMVLARSGIGTITGILTWSQAPLILFENSVHAPGTYDIPFTVQDTLGVPVLIQFTMTMQISNQPDVPNSIQMDGTFSVL